jgi:3-phosphoshikimate 1-carboxyvinyltransferase
MSQALVSLGATVMLSSESIAVNSENCALFSTNPIPVRFLESATALRFWLARTLITKGKTKVLISEQLKNRPLQVFLDSLSFMGCIITSTLTQETLYPYCIEITPPPEISQITQADSNVSSQFISGLMMIAPLLKDGMNLRFSQLPVSYEYLQLTKDVMSSYSINSYLEEDKILIAGDCHYVSKSHYQIEPELSGGAVLLALGAFSEQGIGIIGKPEAKWHPDWEIISILMDMGCRLLSNGEIVAFSSESLHGISKDMETYPDLVPLTAVLALFADSPTNLINISRLKYKESNRIKGLTKAFDQLDVMYALNDSNLTIYPLTKPPSPAILDTQNDHRLAMAFTILCLHYPQLSISETESVKKSCPEFFTLLARLKNQITA